VDDARPLSSSGPTWIGWGALAFALAAMAVDHLLGTERDDGERGLADPVTFAVAAGLCLVTAVLVFGWVAPRARARGPERAAAVALICSVLAVVPGVALAWLGSPFVVAAGGVDLGLEARNGPRRPLALAAVVVGVAFLAFGVVAYAYAAVQGVSEL
jgi:hypothetical protein